MKAYEALERAADYLDMRGHHKGWYISEAGSVCAAGAIKAVCSGYPSSLGMMSKDEESAAQALANGAGLTFVRQIADWNDAPERTQDEVTSTMRAVAATLQAKEGASLGVRQHVAESTVVADSHADAAVMPEVLFR